MDQQVAVRRRAILGAVAATPVTVALVAACGADDRAPKRVPLRQPDADSHVRWTAVRGEQRLLALCDATIDKHPSLAERLGPLVARHDDHVTAVLSDGPLPIAAGGVPAPKAGDVDDDEDAALTALSEVEREVSKSHVKGCLKAVGSTLATVLASAAASNASTADLLRT